MSLNSCRDKVMSVVGKAFRDSGSKYILSEDKLDRLDAVCDSIDKLIEEFDGECSGVSVNDTTKQLTIAIVCDDIILEYGRSHEFFKLIQHLSSFSFAKKENERICVTLSINDMQEGLSWIIKEENA